jgi:hypothetical protein
MSGVISAALMFCQTTLEIPSRSDVVPSRSAAQDINPSHKKLGWAGLEPAANALKGRCSTIELPTREF